MLPPLDTPEKDRRVRRAVDVLHKAFGQSMIEERGFLVLGRNASFLRDPAFRSAELDASAASYTGGAWARHVLHWACLSAMPLPGSLVTVGSGQKQIDFLQRLLGDAKYGKRIEAYFPRVGEEADERSPRADAGVSVAALLVLSPWSPGMLMEIAKILPRLTKGAAVVVENYGAPEKAEERRALDRLFEKVGLSLLEVQTGQGVGLA